MRALIIGAIMATFLGQSACMVRPAVETVGVKFGRTLALRHCGECHAVSPGQTSRLTDAPPFPVLYQRYPVERLGDALEGGMMIGHPRMPVVNLGPDEEAALTAYLASFRPAQGGPR